MCKEELENCGICDSSGTDKINTDRRHERVTYRSQKMKASLLSRLNRAEGQVRGIKGMIEKECYCNDILNQVFAVQSAMKSVAMLLMESHMKNCIVNRINEGDVEIVDELLLTIEKFVK